MKHFHWLSARTGVVWCISNWRKAHVLQVTEQNYRNMANVFFDQLSASSRNKEKAKSSPTKDNHSVTKRLQQELMTLLTSGEPGVSAFPDGDNLFCWVGTIEGGKGTVYDGLKYKLSLSFPSGYPYKPPTVKFDTPCYHPNVDGQGNICLDILKEKWSALYDVRTILLSIQSLLAEPNIDSPLNSHAADLWQNQTAFKKYLHEQYDKDVRNKDKS